MEYLQQLTDVEDAIYSNIIRKQQAILTRTVRPLECIPLLLRDILALNVSECSARAGSYHVFPNRVCFRTVLVWARILTPLKSIANNKMWCCDIDDGTAIMTACFSKHKAETGALEALRCNLHNEHDKVLARHMDRLLEQSMTLMDYGRLKPHQWILIYGQPSCYFRDICIRSYSLLADSDLNCSVSSFELAFKTKLIKWYRRYRNTNKTLIVRRY